MAVKKRNIIYYAVFCLVFASLLAFILFYYQQDIPLHKPHQFAGDSRLDNAQCLKCHGQWHYEMAKPDNHKIVLSKRMPQDFFIDSVAFYESSHRDFRCVDCHSEEYKKAPHDPILRFEGLPVCTDCHDESDTIGRLCSMARIEADYKQSVHAQKSKHFSCYSCHNPHATRLCMRNDSMPDVQVLAESNAMCTKCHATEKLYMIESHRFLPYPELHFSRTRCVDCHGMNADSCLVDHRMPDAKNAIRNCSVCHARNSKVVSVYTIKRLELMSSKKAHAMHCAAGATDNRTMLGVYRNTLLSCIIIGVFAGLLLFIIGHIVLSLIRKRQP